MRLDKKIEDMSRHRLNLFDEFYLMKYHIINDELKRISYLYKTSDVIKTYFL